MNHISWTSIIYGMPYVMMIFSNMYPYNTYYAATYNLICIIECQHMYTES